MGYDSSVCIMCSCALSTREIKNSMWYPDSWCVRCFKEEHERSQEWDCYPDSKVTWRDPRYLIRCEDWYEIDCIKMGYDEEQYKHDMGLEE